MFALVHEVEGEIEMEIFKTRYEANQQMKKEWDYYSEGAHCEDDYLYWPPKAWVNDSYNHDNHSWRVFEIKDGEAL